MSIVRTLYLYLFSFIGLILVVIGCVRLLDMAMKAVVFTQADKEQYFYSMMPPCGPIAAEKLQPLVAPDQNPGAVSRELTAAEIASIENWLKDYNNWQDQRAKIDPLTASRQRDGSNSLAMILIGLPLYWFHWRTIQRGEKRGVNFEH